MIGGFYGGFNSTNNKHPHAQAFIFSRGWEMPFLRLSTAAKGLQILLKGVPAAFGMGTFFIKRPSQDL